jgi:hypothetical protein
MFMKTGKGFAVLIISIVLGSCFNPPEFPNVPEIAFDRIEFNQGVDTDSLVLYITFKDGDGDLGLSAEDINDLGAPFNNITYYQTSPNIVDGKRELIPLNTTAVAAEVIINKTRVTQTYHVLDIPDPSSGELVSIRTREKPGFEFLPPFAECGNYPSTTNAHLLIAAADTVVLDKHATFIDTLYNTNDNNSPVYEIQDVLYRTINPDHYNIEVDFLIKDPNSTNEDHPGFTEFDWSAQPYCMTFDGRFPELSDSKGGALEGTLRYSMESRGFTSLFGIDIPMKLRIQIKDHALNKSNVVFTKVFTLQQI